MIRGEEEERELFWGGGGEFWFFVVIYLISYIIEIDRIVLLSLPLLLARKRLHIHEGLAQAESLLTTQIRAEKIGVEIFHTDNAYPPSPRRLAHTDGIGKQQSMVSCFCPPYDVGSSGTVGAPFIQLGA